MTSLLEPAHARPFGLDVAEMREWGLWRAEVTGRLDTIRVAWALEPSAIMLRHQLQKLLEDLDDAATRAERGVGP